MNSIINITLIAHGVDPLVIKEALQYYRRYKGANSESVAKLISILQEDEFRNDLRNWKGAM